MIAKKIKNILVPLDGSKSSQHGLEMAIVLARGCGAAVTGVYCIKASGRSEFGGGETVSEKEKSQARKILDDSKDLCVKNDVPFSSKMLQGNIGYHIVKTAQSKFDMIIIGSRGRGAMKEMFLGSVSNYVIHASKIPVLVVK